MNFDLGSAISAAATAFFVTGGNPLTTAVAFVAGGTAGGDAKRSARNKARSAFNDAQQDRIQMIQSATAPMKIVYGRARVSGPIAYAQSTGTKGEFMHLVVCLAGHECDAVETVYFNDTAVTLDGSGNVTDTAFSVQKVADYVQAATVAAGATTVVTLTQTPVTKLLTVVRTVGTGDEAQNFIQPATLAGNVVTIDNTGATTGESLSISYQYQTSQTILAKVKAYLGTTTQTADTDLIAASGGKWTSAHRLRGICYLYARLEYEQDVWGSVGLPEISAVVRGRKVWDPRTSTTVWRENSALCVADYLRTYLGATAGEVPDAELITEANVCDELVTTATGVTEARYTCNGVLSEEALPRDNLEAIVQTMAGDVAWAQGRFLVQAGRHLAAEFTLNEDWLADGAITLRPEAARTELINRVVPSYVEPAKAYTTIEAPPVTNATYVAADGGLDLPTTLQLDLVTGAMRAQRLAKIELERNRQGLEVELPCNLRAYDVAPGRVVAVTLARYGWTAKLFTVRSRAYDLVTQTLRLTLRETASAVWDWNFGVATTVDLTPNTSLPNAWAKPAALAAMTVTSGTPWLQKLGDGTVQCRAAITWTQAAEMAVVRGGRVEVRWRRADSVTWQQGAPLAGDATTALIGPLEEGRVIVVGIRAVSMFDQAGPWAYVSHLPVGKSQPPSSVADFSSTVLVGALRLSWTRPTDLDYAETELRLGSSWATAALLHVGTSGRFDWPWPAAGTYTVLAKHRDSSGNESAAAAVMPVKVNSNGTIERGVTAWLTASGAASTWSYTGGTAYWTLPGEVYLVGNPNIGTSAVDTLQMSPQAATLVQVDETSVVSSFYSVTPATFVGLLFVANPTAETLTLLLSGELAFSWAGPAGVNSANAGNSLAVDLYVDTVFNRQLVRAETVSLSNFPQVYRFTFLAELSISPGQTLRLETVFGGSTATGERTLYSKMRSELIKR